MEGVVDHHAVQQAEVLDHGASADVELAALVAGGVDAWQHLHVLRQVGGAADGGHLLYLRGGDFLHADLRLHLAFFFFAVGDFDSTEQLCRGLEVDGLGDDAVLLEDNLLGVFLVAYVFDFEGVGAFLDFVDEEEAVDVGGAAVVGSVEDHVGKRDGLAVALVEEDSLHCALGTGKLKIEN